MKVRIKRLVPEAELPRYMHPEDGGMDLVAVSKIFDEYGAVVYGTGLAIEIPPGFIGLIFPRGSNAKKDLSLANAVGVIDPGYTGEVLLKFKPMGYFAQDLGMEDGVISDSYDFICFGKEYPEDPDYTDLYTVGDRIGQLIILERPHIVWEEVFELSESERGTGGFGSTNTGLP